MSIIKEFKEFAIKGNVVDMAVGIIIGGAFTTIVKSMVDDLLMPPLSLLGGSSASAFSGLFINLSPQSYSSLSEATSAGAPVLRYGLFLQNVVSFLIVAFAVFLMVKGINRLKRSEAPSTATADAPTPEDIQLLREIRDLLKK